MPSLDRRAFLSTSAAALLADPAGAQGTLLDRVQIVVGEPAEAAVDRLCHTIAGGLRGGAYAKDVQIENRPGAGGRTAVESVKDAPSDGSVLLATPAETLALYPHIYKLSYDPLGDVTPITTACTTDFVLAVGPAIPETVKTLDAYFTWCKGDSRQAAFGSPGPGSLPHLVGVLLGKSAGIDLWHTPYPSFANVIDDLLSGKLPAACGPLGAFLPHALAGRANLLGISGATPSRFAPGIPTFAESGLKDMVFSEWFGFFAPNDTSPRVALRANQALRAVLARNEVIDALAVLALEARTSTPAELTRRLESDHERMGALVRRIGFTDKT
jgi:tripartite-type tricarboxylate transporter receptor subunit TctC